MLQFILERANYWAIIGLMMVGLYIAFQSTNMIKRLVGLSIFQTSVFLFYITLGKVAGGSAPILFGRDQKKGHGDDHGSSGHAPAGADSHHATGTVPSEAGDADHALPESEGHSAIEEGGDVADHAVEHAEQPLETLAADPVEAGVEEATDLTASPDLVSEPIADVVAPHAPDVASEGPNALTGLYELYSNPLPHVLILTAIVVGVATLSVGLAIVVRIREAYGSIESDEVRMMDIETADAQDADEIAEAMA